MTEQMRLRPPDFANLADERGGCPNCAGVVGNDCEVCKGKGTIPLDTGRQRLSHSSIGTQLACLKRYEWAYVHRLEKIDRPIALSLGRAFQRAIELKDPQAGAEAYARERQTFDQAEADKLLVDMAIVYSAASGYLARYPDDDGIQDEFEYLIRLRNPSSGWPSLTFDLYGFADGVIDHGDYLELIENKFQTRIDEVSVKRVKLDRQVGLEAYALWRITGKPVRVIRYRITKKPSIRQKQGESIEEFVERLKADYAERPEFYFHEETTFRDPSDLLVIEAELWDWAEQRRDAEHRGFFARNTGACHDWGGCPYLDLCVHGNQAMDLYRKRTA